MGQLADSFFGKESEKTKREIKKEVEEFNSTLKEYRDLTDIEADKAYKHFLTYYKQSIEDYMQDFLFDKNGVAYCK